MDKLQEHLKGWKLWVFEKRFRLTVFQSSFLLFKKGLLQCLGSIFVEQKAVGKEFLR